MLVTQDLAVLAVMDDLSGAAQTDVVLPYDILAPPAHQAQPVVLPSLLDTLPLHPVAPVTLRQISLNVLPSPVKTLGAEDLQEG